tara:strand:- start:13114 stop:13635 length:522 start_codon:yes stop_codon:yes gene_type:complete
MVNTGHYEETPKNITEINSSLHFYIAQNTPTGELNQVKAWLKQIKRECEYKIGQIQNIQNERKRVENWRRDINEIAKEFRTTEMLKLDLASRAELIRKKLQCPPSRAKAVAEYVQSWAKRENKKQRNADICFKFAHDESAEHLAKVYEISRQQIYNIIKADEGKKMIKSRKKL